MSAVLTDDDYVAIAEAVAERMLRFSSPVLTLVDATAYVGKNSDTAFYRWCETNRVTACSQGRYARTKLDQALNKESKQRIAKIKRHAS